MAKRIVIIDDSQLVLAMVSDLLKGAGYEVHATNSGIEANQHIYSTTPPDLILIDVMMPMLNGDRKVRLLKERERSAAIPVLLMSTKPEEELALLAESSGADGYLRKPFKADALLEQVSRYLAG